MEFERLAVGKKRRAYEDGTHAPRPTVVAKKKSSPSVGESAVCVETAGSPRTKPRNCLETGVRPINSVSSDALTYQTLSRARGGGIVFLGADATVTHRKSSGTSLHLCLEHVGAAPSLMQQ